MGELVLGRKDDGTLEILRADDEIEMASELWDDLPADGDYRRDGDVLKVDASGTLLAYVIVGFDRLTNVYHMVRTADREGR